MKSAPVLLAIFGISFPAISASQPGPLLDATRVAEIARWLPASPQGFGKPISERSAWSRLAALPEGKEAIARAEELAKTPIPELPDELYLDFSKTGNRTRCQAVMSARDRRVFTFTLAECLENKGRFIEPLSRSISEICKERSWVLPAHDGKLGNFHGTAFEPDLRATLVAWDLATTDCLLGGKLPAATRELIRENVHRRVLSPVREMIKGKRAQIHWLRATHNWNAVCLAGVVGAALAIEDSKEERAFYVVAAEKAIGSFLSGFTPDGYCSEGIGYWNYGYGRFLMLAELVRQSTAGRLDLLARPDARQPALFAIRSEVINGIYPSVADCSPGSAPDRDLVRFIRRRMGMDAGNNGITSSGKGGRMLSFPLMDAFMPENLPVIQGEPLPPELPLRTWFEEGGVLICRPAKGKTPFATVIKGGHNAEHHNHNDLGSFSVVLGTVLICDPGSEEYTRRTFSSKRYDSKVLNSYGHAVPVVAGALQRAGREARAVVIGKGFEDETDHMTFDLRSAYSVPQLEKLERRFDYLRGEQPALVVRDTVSFSEPQSFETALVTWSPWKQAGPGELVIGTGKEAVRVSIDSGRKAVLISSETIEEDVRTAAKPVRIKLALQEPVKDTVLSVRISPAVR